MTEFQPTPEQVALDIAPTLEYERGSTTLALDFGAGDTITEAFLSDKTEGRTTEEIHQLGNVDLRSTEYEISTQAWANPTLAQQNREPEVAGIRIRRSDS